MTKLNSSANPRDRSGLDPSLAFADDAVKTLTDAADALEAARHLLPAFVKHSGAPRAALVAQQAGRWNVTAHCDASGQVECSDGAAPLPIELIAEAASQSESRIDGKWWILPYQLGVTAGDCNTEPRAECFAFQLPPRLPGQPTQTGVIRSMAELIVAVMIRIQGDNSNRQRIVQLTRVLEAAASWQRNQLQQPSDENTLLRQIADTATELLDCQRASIFLWDKRRKKLIGRPALGIAGDALTIPDDAGVVGEVLATGEPQLWRGGSDDESRVNREVDRVHAFDTRSLVAVPLVGQRGEMIGVFEALNHNDNRFDRSHVLLLSDLATHASVVIQAARLQRQLTESRDRLVRDAANSVSLIGRHPAVEAVRQSATKIAQTDLSVLILGKNGTGKEVVARHIHFESDRKHGPFIAVNCAALVESLLESELFGYEQGSFTGATTARAGKFELANRGTLFLDEVGDMSPGGQSKLLRVLEQREVVRVGGSVPIPVDVRVIAATNQPLDQLIAQQRFREDLFFRLNVVSLSLPELSQRGKDVLLLAEHFLKHFCYEIGRKVPALAESAQTALLSHSWPGNVRELRNTIERVCYLSGENVIQASDLELRGGPPRSSVATADRHVDLPASLAEATRLFQIEHIRDAIQGCRGNMTEAAARLDLHRSNLYRKMKQLGMQAEQLGE